MGGEGDTPQDINRMNQMSTWEIAAKPFELMLGKSIAECSREDIATVRHAVQTKIADEADGLAFVKTHHALVMDRGQPTINFDATAGAIYIVRNPLDVAISFSHHIDAPIDTAIEQMSCTDLETAMGDASVYEVYGSWSQHVESWTRKAHRTIYVMKYEEMLDAPEAVFGGLARHLLLEPSHSELAKAIELSSFENLQKQEVENQFNEKPKIAKQFFRKGQSGQWRKTLSQSQIDRIVGDHREQMERFGYLPS